MKSFCLTVAIIFCLTFSVQSQEQDLFSLFGTKLVNDSLHTVLTHNFHPYTSIISRSKLSLFLQQKEVKRSVLHTTKNGKEVELYLFPGLSERKALVVGGIHGSELSSIEVAKTLIQQLSRGDKPFYNVVIIPALFPENAYEAMVSQQDRLLSNSGRYTDKTAADPNRQMPMLGKPFLDKEPYDAMKREIEGENQALLQLIQTYKPDRIINIHAIRDRSKAGVFADPRTDCAGYALGFDTDKSLALMMAQYIQSQGGACPGNNLGEGPTALYYLDPPIAEEGQKQERSFNGSNVIGRGQGVSMGGWCSTAVCYPDEALSRPAIRTFTMEFPGYQQPSEYKTKDDQQKFTKMVKAYASSIQHYFLQSYFVEEYTEYGKRFASK